MSPDRLIYMANQIGKFFQSQGHDNAVPGIAEHIRKFWDPPDALRNLFPSRRRWRRSRPERPRCHRRAPRPRAPRSNDRLPQQRPLAFADIAAVQTDKLQDK